MEPSVTISAKCFRKSVSENRKLLSEKTVCLKMVLKKARNPLFVII